MPSAKGICGWSEHGTDRNAVVILLAEALYEAGKKPPPGVKAVSTPESGIGDDAYFAKDELTGFRLKVKKGGTYFSGSVRSNPKGFAKANTPEMDEKDKEIERALAHVILKKL